MADVLTFEELRGPITNKKIAWLGDGNNVVYSLIEAATQFNFQLAIACPKKFEPNKKIIKWANSKKANIFITRDPKEVAEDADAIMTDKPISMGDINVNKKQKKQLLKSYQVNKKIMKLAKKDAIFMHCLPASRGEEVTNEVMDGKQSAVWLEALNRMHVQKSVIQWCLKLL
jgi:ornithine carbamoyltransferase